MKDFQAEALSCARRCPHKTANGVMACPVCIEAAILCAVALALRAAAPLVGSAVPAPAIPGEIVTGRVLGEALGAAVSDFDSMPAGPKMDALVGEHLMGWKWDESDCRICGWPIVPNSEPGCWADNCSMRPAPERRADAAGLLLHRHRGGVGGLLFGLGAG